ncbi:MULTISPECIES: signal peptidase I [Streptococcus]|jgi:signal peptidase I|uniref:Signal peptidase I n=1 Tax=Streptococcus ruminicola TaxID=2686210 RepID=A0A6G8HYZ8_9STRE|nr:MULTISPECIES: signal peptidase I [Streptococcus]MBE6163190.1 signal peptidase I [Streptococcus equinus]QIM46089.1 signal peptidase I [Streptococcus ruminicola]SEI83035.1 signal peptidase I [Streptococcus equinus]SEK87577.1 signal peptidase I [Streptococcus equinus]SFF92719.1 signal peptidase I [Streptococcus equinus]
MKKNENITLPTTSEIEELYKKAKYRKLFSEKIRSTVFMLIVVAAFAILVAMLYLPTLRIYGKSMKGTLESGDIVLAVKSNRFKTGDVVAFYYNNNILVKRVIAKSGDWVNITKDGTVYVNDKKINEPYIENKAYGETNIKFPYQVPENRIFVLGDNRKVSIDSRNTSVGAVSDEQLVGKLIFRIWPLSDIGTLN